MTILILCILTSLGLADSSPQQDALKRLIDSFRAGETEQFAGELGYVPEVHTFKDYEVVSRKVGEKEAEFQIRFRVTGMNQYDQDTHQYKKTSLTSAKTETQTYRFKKKGTEWIAEPLGHPFAYVKEGSR